MTYMLGFTVNKTNFKRTVDNALNIVEQTDAEVIICDHHLTREPKFRERIREVWERAKKLGKNYTLPQSFRDRIR